MSTPGVRARTGPPEIETLQGRLTGYRFPGGTVRIQAHEAWLGHDAMAAPQAPAGTLDPLWILVIGLRGMGVGIAELAELAAAGPDDTMLFGELGLEQHTILRTGADYRVSGSIAAVTRHHGRRAGLFDQLDFHLDISGADGAAHAEVSSSFLFRRAG
jgi:hypothetical protein